MKNTQLKSNEKKLKKQFLLKKVFFAKYFFNFFLRPIKKMYYNVSMTGRSRKNLRRFINRMVKNFEKIY